MNILKGMLFVSVCFYFACGVAIAALHPRRLSPWQVTKIIFLWLAGIISDRVFYRIMY